MAGRAVDTTSSAHSATPCKMMGTGGGCRRARPTRARYGSQHAPSSPMLEADDLSSGSASWRVEKEVKKWKMCDS